jgi:hypothetical protein
MKARRPIALHDPALHTREAIADIVDDMLFWLVTEFGPGEMSVTVRGKRKEYTIK